MDTIRHPTVRERRSDERTVWRIGVGVSLLLHVLVFLLWPSDPMPTSSEAAAGPRAGDASAASGGMQAMNVRVPPPTPIVPPRAPVVTVEPVPPVEFDDEAAPDLAEVLGERPGLDAPGVDDGTGQGDGGTSDEGLFRRVPPSPRGMILPPSNADLRGSEVSVWVFVDERGRVVPDSTRLDPPTRDGDFNRRLIREAADWVFEPAREGGEAVSAWFPYTISM